MKKILVYIAILLPFTALAQQVNSSASDSEKYEPELGYFQKAHRDASDPRFMITDSDNSFSLGVGGTVHFSTYYDFDGALNGYCFSPSTISIPTDKTDNFGYTVTCSNIYLKARATKGKTKLTAYLALSGVEDSGNDNVTLDKAYVSINGLTVGKTYSFFMDLEAGPMTVDLQGPNTQIAMVHNLIGYTQPIGKHWTVAAALEAPHSIAQTLQSYEINTNYNKFPDLATRVIYRGDKGHIQAGLLLRQVSYWVSKEGFASVDKGKSKYTSGYGLSLSGNYSPSEKITFSAQGVYGKGVSYYIQDLAPLCLSLGMEAKPDSEGYATLDPLTAFGGYASASVKWTDSLYSSVVYGLCRLNDNELYTVDPFRRSDYVAANCFYYFSPYCFVGLEYLYGHKSIYATGSAESTGYANRLNACICYRF